MLIAAIIASGTLFHIHYLHDLRRTRKLSRITWTLLVLAIAFVVASFSVFWFQYPLPTPQPFRAELRSVSIYRGGGPLSFYMARFHSIQGDIISPVVYLTYIELTNLQRSPSTINEFTVSVAARSDGPWETLQPISLLSSELYFLFPIRPAAGGTIARVLFPYGTYFLGMPAKSEYLPNAELLKPSPVLELELRREIEPGHVAFGWAAFDIKGHQPILGFFRIAVRDAANISHSDVVPLPSSPPGRTMADVQPGGIYTAGSLTDLSKAYVKFYTGP